MPSPIQLTAGQIFAKDFRVVRPLSSGGMGSVYVVEQLSTGAERALKLMHRELVADARQRGRFEQEAKIGASIRSDHVVKVIVAGVDDASGLPYLVMELLEGQELEAMLVAQGPLTPADLAVVFTQLCHALGAAHVAGVVHRDLKPENIFIASSNRADVPFTVKILDFGIAKVVAEAQHSMTQSVGTPLYMSPEQTNPRAKIAPAADVWALGLIAFRCLTGKPFWMAANVDGGSLEQIMAEVLVHEIPPASHRAGELGVRAPIPDGFDAWFKACVTRDPAQRLANATDAWRALAPTLGARVSGLTPIAPTVGGASGRISLSGGGTVVGGGTDIGLAPGFAGNTYTTGNGVAAPTISSTSPKSHGALVGAFAVVALGGIGTAGYFAYRGFAAHKKAPTTEEAGDATYCAEPVERYLVSDCSVALPASAEAHRAVSWRITKKEGRVIRAERRNGFGVAIDDEHGVATTEYTYGSGKTPKEIVRKNHLGLVVEKAVVSDDGARAEFFDRFGNSKARHETHAVAGTYVFDEAGHLVEEHLSNARGKPTMSPEHVYGYKQKYDERGLTTSITGIDDKGAPMRTQEWMAAVTRTFDEHANIKRGQFVDASGIPVLNRSGVAGWEADFDDSGNQIAYRNLSADGRPTPTTDGYAQLKYEIDGHGDVVKTAFLDASGKPAANKLGYASFTMKFDGRGNVVEQTYLDVDGKPAMGPEPASTVKLEFDDKNQRTRVAYFDRQGAPMAATTGMSSFTLKYDDRGNVIEERYFGKDGAPVRTTSGYATEKTTYDDHDRPILQIFLDAAGEPTLSNDGYAKVTKKYDEKGNEIETDYFDVAGAPTGDATGVAKTLRTFDELGLQTSVRHLDEQGQPIARGSTYASVKVAYDDNGRELETTYFSASGERKDYSGVAERHWKRDTFGNVVSETQVGADGKPASPVAETTTEYDERDHAILVKYAAPPGGALDKSAPAGYRRKYDERGNLVEERKIDAAGNVVVLGGAAGFDAKYDLFGNRIEQKLVGPAGEAVAGSSKWCKLKQKYDVRGRIVESAYFGVDDAPVVIDQGFSIVREEYDDVGNETSIRYFGVDGAPVVANSYHGILTEFDDFGRETKRTHIDKDGKPMSGFVVLETAYDDRGAVSQESLFDASGAPAPNSENAASVKYKHDAFRRQTERAIFDKDGKPVADPKGVSITRYKYDSAGSEIEEALFGSSGAPVDNTEGWSVSKKTYDGSGKLVKTELVNTAGMVVRTLTN